MKNSKIGFGVFLLTGGLIWILANFGVINWSILNSIIDLWPLIFVVIGVNIIFRKNGYVRAGTWMLFLAVLIAYPYFFESGYSGGTPANREQIEITEAYDNAELKISLVGTKLELAAQDRNLLNASVSDPDVMFQPPVFDHSASRAMFNFRRDKKHFTTRMFENKNYRNEFKLGKSAVWDTTINVVAVNGMLDMSELKVRDVDIDLVAGNLDIAFGDNYESMKARIDAVAAELDVAVPESAGVKVKVNGVFSSNHIRDLGWEKDGSYYVSPGYDKAENKINLDISIVAGTVSFNLSK